MARPKTIASTYQPLTVRFPAEVLEQVRRTASQEDRSINEQVVHIVKRWVSEKGEKSHELVGSRSN